MGCHLSGAKLLPKPMLTYCQLGPQEQKNLIKIQTLSTVGQCCIPRVCCTTRSNLESRLDINTALQLIVLAAFGAVD